MAREQPSIQNETGAPGGGDPWENRAGPAAEQDAVDHACEWETSSYLYIRPELVQMDQAVDEKAWACGASDRL